MPGRRRGAGARWWPASLPQGGASVRLPPPPSSRRTLRRSTTAPASRCSRWRPASCSAATRARGRCTRRSSSTPRRSRAGGWRRWRGTTCPTTVRKRCSPARRATTSAASSARRRTRRACPWTLEAVIHPCLSRNELHRLTVHAMCVCVCVADDIYSTYGVESRS